MKNIFLDTNILIDVIAGRAPYSEPAAKLLDYAEKGNLTLYISALSYSHIYYVVKKNTSHKELLSILRNIESMMETIDVTKQVISSALISDFNDFEDAIQYNTALSNGKIHAIATRNSKDFKKSALPVLTPEEIISILESN